MKFNAKYLWAYVLITGILLMAAPELFPSEYDDYGFEQTHRLIILRYLSVPVILVGIILSIVQFLLASIAWSKSLKKSGDSQAPSPHAPVPDVSQPLTTVAPKGRSGLWTGGITMIVGVFIAFLPLLVASLSTRNGHNMWNESDPSSGGAALWALLITIPVGGITVLVGLIILIVALVRTSKQ